MGVIVTFEDARSFLTKVPITDFYFIYYDLSNDQMSNDKCSIYTSDTINNSRSYCKK